MARKQVVLAVFFAVICLTVSWPLNHATAQTQPPATGDWIVYDNTTVSNTQILLRGDLDVYGNLTLNNVDLYLYGTSNGHRSINVHDGGTLEIINSEVLPYISTYYYNFKANSSSTVTIQNSDFEKTYNLDFYTNDVDLSHVTVNNSMHNSIKLRSGSIYTIDNVSVNNSGNHGIELTTFKNSDNHYDNITVKNSYEFGINHISSSTGNLTLTNSLIQGSRGQIQFNSDAAVRVTLSNSTISNPDPSGSNMIGLMHAQQDSILQIVNSTIINNSILKGNSPHSSNYRSIHAGVYAHNITMINSVISGNYNRNSIEYFTPSMTYPSINCYGNLRMQIFYFRKYQTTVSAI